MPKDELIEKIVLILKQMPEDKIQAVADFAEFLLKKGEGDFVEHSGPFSFLNEEEDIYTLGDLKKEL